MRGIYDKLPEGYRAAIPAYEARAGDLHAYKGRYVDITAGSSLVGRHGKDVPGGVIYCNHLMPAERVWTEEEIIAILMVRGRATADRDGVDSILKLQYSGHACACMGMRDGEPFCNCHMNSLLVEHKLAVHAALVQERP